MDEENLCVADHMDVTEAEKWSKSKSFVDNCEEKPCSMQHASCFQSLWKTIVSHIANAASAKRKLLV